MDLAREVIRRGKFRLARVCRVLSVSRSNQYENPKSRPARYKRKDDDMVLKSILEVTKDRDTYGYPRVIALINRDRRKTSQSAWNEKRVLRVMQINNLTLQKSISPISKRPHLGQVITIHSNVRYCSDILEVRCWNGEKVFIAFSLDCHDREAMSFVAEKRPLFHENGIAELVECTRIVDNSFPVSNQSAQTEELGCGDKIEGFLRGGIWKRVLDTDLNWAFELLAESDSKDVIHFWDSFDGNVSSIDRGVLNFDLLSCISRLEKELAFWKRRQICNEDGSDENAFRAYFDLVISLADLDEIVRDIVRR